MQCPLLAGSGRTPNATGICSAGTGAQSRNRARAQIPCCTADMGLRPMPRPNAENALRAAYSESPDGRSLVPKASRAKADIPDTEKHRRAQGRSLDTEFV